MKKMFTILTPCLLLGATFADETSARRRERALQFHQRAQERTGLLIPLYVYPAEIHSNRIYNRLIKLKRRYETVPMWVILNPASGPGRSVDPNYTKAIDRLQGAGCVTLGYVATGYGKRSRQTVQADIDAWLKLYPRIQGLFFDEMIYDDTEAGVRSISDLTQYARDAGCWPLVANPGTDTPGRYFAADAADVFVVHEGDQWPDESRLHGDFFGGYADYPPFTRAILIHSLKEFNPVRLARLRLYARWVYFTDDPYRPNDPQADNPWDSLSRYLDILCAQLSRDATPSEASSRAR